MPVTVASLVDTQSLQLTLRTRTTPTDRPVSWVHVSELPDPARFLEGGELLLTTGLPLAAPDADREGYVRRLADAGVVGLGIGTGLSLPEVPGDLLGAADACGLAVVEVPRQTPFIAISRAVSAALAAEEYAGIARASAVQQELTRAAVAPGAPGSVVQRLARHVGGWALLMDPAGTALESSPPDARSRVTDLATTVERLRGARPPAAAALSRPGETVLVQALGTGARARGFLAVGRPGPFPTAERHVVNAAALLLTLRLEQARTLASATAAVRGAVLRLLLLGRTEAVVPVLAALGERLPEAPVSVHVVLGGTEDRATAVDVVADAAGHAAEPVLAADLDEAVVVLAGRGSGLTGLLTELPRRVPGVALGTSAPTPWPELAQGLRQARQAAEHGRATGRPVTAFADLAGSGMAALLDPAATAAFADAVLAPLVAADRAGPGNLVESLRAWLAAHGQWEPAAAGLGVHRHTLRKRIHRAAQLLGRDLDSPGVRAELWLALHPPTG